MTSKARDIADLGSNDVLETTSTGLDVTGTVTADGLTVDGATSTDGILVQNPLSGSFYNANIEFRRDTTLAGAKIQTERNSTGGVGLSFNYTANNTAETSGTYSKAMQIANNGDVSFYEDTGTTAKMVWSSSDEKLTVDGSVRFGYNQGAQTNVTTWAQNSDNALIFESTSNPDYASGSWGGLQFHSANGYGGPLAGIAVNHRYGDATERQWADGMAFMLKNGGSADNWSEVMSLRSSGNVGIGTASPSASLHVHGGTSFIAAKFKGYVTGRTGVIGGDNNGVWLGVGDDTYSQKNSITLQDLDNSVRLKTNGTERARLDSSGNLLVGTSASSSKWSAGNGVDRGVEIRNNNFGIAMHTANECLLLNTDSITAFSRFYYRGTAVGNIATNGSSTFYNTTSDERAKKNIKDADHSVDINDIKIREFDWKVDDKHERYGVIAQELETVYPEAVHSPKDPDELKGVDYSKLVPLLVKEIQTLKARIETLENN